MNPVGQRKCHHCKQYFVPDPRQRRRQRYCAAGECRRASKVKSQKQWLKRPENRAYFSGPENVARVRAWRAENPGYGRSRDRSRGALQEMMNPQVTVVQEARLQDDVVALQDTWQAQPPLLVGLIAHLTGTALQEDMVPVMRRLITRGQALLEPKRQSTNPMIEKHLLCPERVRRVPPHFSWVDHRLVRDQHLRRADAKAWALYLVLVTVSDEHGLSYYGEATLGRLLSLSVAEVVAARGQLLAAALIAYEAPLYQVLALEGVGR